MPKCTLCNQYATYLVKSGIAGESIQSPLCTKHASHSHKKKIRLSVTVPVCKACGQPLAILDWNRDVLMFRCSTPRCPKSFYPQGYERKDYLDELERQAEEKANKGGES